MGPPGICDLLLRFDPASPASAAAPRANLAELTGLHADIDFKSVAATEAEILAALEALPLLPNRVNHSGHGMHAYWLFKKALTANEDNIARLEAALKRLATVVAGDPAVCEAARLMRLPGSHNSKNGDWLEVTNIVHREGGYTSQRTRDLARDCRTGVDATRPGDLARRSHRIRG